MREEYLWHAVRAVITAIVAGGLTALTTWSATDDIKAVIVAGGTAALTILAGRLGIEAPIDGRAAVARAQAPILVPPARPADHERSRDQWGKPL